MGYPDLRAAHIRLVILRWMAEDPGFAVNDSVAQDVAGRFGFACSRDAARNHLRWLAEQGLVTLQEAEGVLVATLTARGADVASGAAVVDGVKRPSPRD